jgi:hypothetical protein
LLLLLLLLLVLLLKLRWHRGHRRRPGLEALLRLRLAHVARELRLELLRSLRRWLLLLLLLHPRVGGVLRLDGGLPKAGGLWCERARLLLSLLLPGSKE